MKKLILPLLFSTSLLAAEADHFSKKDSPILDLGQSVNEMANEYLEKAVELNQDCNEESLYQELKKYFANHSKGKLVKRLLHEDEFSKRVIPIKQSVFQDWSVWNGFLLGRKAAETSPLALSPMIQIGDIVIGIDKLEHMFGMGNIYFNRFYKKGKTLKNVLKNGIFREKTILGGNVLATGVFSYADLAANFNGMRFWNHILQKNDDILGRHHNLGPYVKCENNQFIINHNKPIQFENYVDHSMDESVNCSKFATKSGARKYSAVMDDKNIMACDLTSPEFLELQTKYDVETQGDSKKRPISHWIINDDGIEDVSYFNEF